MLLTQSRLVDARSWEGKEMGSNCLMSMGLLGGGDENILKVNRGDVCTTL